MKKVTKKRFFAGKLPVWAGLFLAVVIGALGAYSIYRYMSAADSRHALIKFKAPEVQVQMAQYERKIYPYSIIRGGVRSREELSASVRADNVVAEHYSNFDVSKARVVQAQTTRAMYVSYRRGDTVYWTANRIQIPKGETLITDGTIEARTRCGNMLSDTPMTPLAGLGEEPDMESFDTPHVAELDSNEMDMFTGSTPLAQLADMELAESPIPLTGRNTMPSLSRTPSYPMGTGGTAAFPVASTGSGKPGNPKGPGMPGNPGGSGMPGDPITPDYPDTNGVNDVPEPCTLVLVFTGLAMAAGVKIRQIKQQGTLN